MDARPARRVLHVAARLARDLSIYASPPTHTPGKPHSDGGGATSLQTFDRVVLDPELRTTCRSLFANGHYAMSVEEAFKYVNNLVKHRTGLPADGADLMNRALSLGNPVLKLSDLKTVSQRDQQLGYMQMLAGAMTGIRNPRAHEHRYLDEPQAALELLSFANHLCRVLAGARRARGKR
jgi:uncharacterized protein (TIGR02391 family)